MEIIRATEDSVTLRILDIMYQLQQEGDFCGKNSRLATSYLVFLITEDDKDVGFLYFVEENYKNFLFADMGIIKEYRGRGLATKALEFAVSHISNNLSSFVLAEIESSNESSIAVVNKLNAVKLSSGHYLLQSERLDEYKNYIDEYQINLLETASCYKDIMKLVYESNNSNK